MHLQRAVRGRTALHRTGRARPQPRLQSGGATTLPEDLLREQSIRIQLLYSVGMALWLSNLVLDFYISPHGDRGPHKLLIESIGVAMTAGVALFARYRRCHARIKANVGVAFMVPNAFLLALLNSWAVHPTTERPISGITVLILLFGMLSPRCSSHLSRSQWARQPAGDSRTAVIEDGAVHPTGHRRTGDGLPSEDRNRRPHDAEDLLHRAAAIVSDWDNRRARMWWQTHLPQLSSPSALAAAGWPATNH